MRFSLINPAWRFCRQYLLRVPGAAPAAGVRLLAQTFSRKRGTRSSLWMRNSRGSPGQRCTVASPSSGPDFTVVTTAPSYLFWRCAPPELRVPRETVDMLRDVGGTMIGVGPHASTTPKTALRKLGVDAVVLGECEEILPQLAGDWRQCPFHRVIARATRCV